MTKNETNNNFIYFSNALNHNTYFTFYHFYQFEYLYLLPVVLYTCTYFRVNILLGYCYKMWVLLFSWDRKKKKWLNNLFVSTSFFYKWKRNGFSSLVIRIVEKMYCIIRTIQCLRFKMYFTTVSRRNDNKCIIFL